MKKEELLKYVDTELQALKYYALQETRKSIDFSKPIYNQLISIGYTKTVLPLDYRCAHCRITSDKPISKDTPIEDVKFSDFPRNNSENIYTGLEFWIIKYPEDHEWVYNYLNDKLNLFVV